MKNERKIVHYEEDTGKVLGFYTEEIHGDLIPLPNIEIDFDQWQNALLLGFNAISLVPESFGQLYSKDLRTLKESLESKISELNQACSKEICSGFTSSGFGSLHEYQSDRDDQDNLAGAAQSYKDRNFKCKNLDLGINPDGIWEYKLHTQNQIQIVFEDGATTKEQYLMRCHALKEQAKLCKTISELELIVW